MSDERVMRLFTPEEYLMIERDAPLRSEYDNGRIYSMAGASDGHKNVVDNITGFLFLQLRKTPCRATTHDTKVRPSKVTAYYYPDVVIHCGKPEYEDSDSGILLNPLSIIEVMSPSTESYDRVVKYNRYINIESLCDYVLVSQNMHQVEHHSKNEEGEWTCRILTRLTDKLTLKGAPASLTLEEIYDRIEIAPLE